MNIKRKKNVEIAPINLNWSEKIIPVDETIKISTGDYVYTKNNMIGVYRKDVDNQPVGETYYDDEIVCKSHINKIDNNLLEEKFNVYIKVYLDNSPDIIILKQIFVEKDDVNTLYSIHNIIQSMMYNNIQDVVLIGGSSSYKLSAKRIIATRKIINDMKDDYKIFIAFELSNMTYFVISLDDEDVSDCMYEHHIDDNYFAVADNEEINKFFKDYSKKDYDSNSYFYDLLSKIILTTGDYIRNEIKYPVKNKQEIISLMYESINKFTPYYYIYGDVNKLMPYYYVKDETVVVGLGIMIQSHDSIYHFKSVIESEMPYNNK